MRDFTFHDKPNPTTGRSFRVYGDAETLISDPGKALLVAGMALIAIVNVHVIQGIGFGVTPAPTSVVLGESTQASIQSGVNPTLYQMHVKAIVRSYLEQRAVFEQDAATNRIVQDEWKQLVGSTKDALFAMKVPGQYKEVHMDAVLAILVDGTMLEESEINSELSPWTEILEKYPWMNSE